MIGGCNLHVDPILDHSVSPGVSVDRLAKTVNPSHALVIDSPRCPTYPWYAPAGGRVGVGVVGECNLYVNLKPDNSVSQAAS